jgi:hypothetical protein
VRTGRAAFADDSLTVIMLSAQSEDCARQQILTREPWYCRSIDLWVMRLAPIVVFVFLRAVQQHLPSFSMSQVNDE